MSYRANDYTEAITSNENWKKCFSPANNMRLLDYLIERQLIPSQVSVNRAIADLKFRRTDGGSQATDLQAAVNTAQRNLDAVIAEAAAAPLTRNELDDFASLSSISLQRRYWDNDGINTFAVRYNKAHREHGFQIPARPRVEEEQPVASGSTLSVEEYRKLPAREVAQRYSRDRSFRASVDLLIKGGKI